MANFRNHHLLVSQGVLNILGSALILMLAGGPPETGLWVATGAAAVSGLLTLNHVRDRWEIADLPASLHFLGNLVPVYAVLWFDLAHISRLGVYWIPCLPHELAVLTIAILAPPVRQVGVLAILVVPLLAGLQLSGLPPESLTLAPTRPMAGPLAFSLFALVLYFFRVRGAEALFLAAMHEAELESVRRYTSSILAIKDLANSPIQAITFDSELLKAKFPETAPVAARIQESARKLHELNRVLDSQLPDQLQDDLSFDASAKLVAALRPPEA